MSISSLEATRKSTRQWNGNIYEISFRCKLPPVKVRFIWLCFTKRGYFDGTRTELRDSMQFMFRKIAELFRKYGRDDEEISAGVRGRCSEDVGHSGRVGGRASPPQCRRPRRTWPAAAVPAFRALLSVDVRRRYAIIYYRLINMYS